MAGQCGAQRARDTFPFFVLADALNLTAVVEAARIEQPADKLRSANLYKSK